MYTPSRVTVSRTFCLILVATALLLTSGCKRNVQLHYQVVMSAASESTPAVAEDLLLFGWKVFDGWNENDPKNFKLMMQSYGSDGDDGLAEQGYAADYPPEPFSTILEINDHMIDVCSLKMDVTLQNNTINDIVLRLMVIYPRHGSLEDDQMPQWPSSDSERDETNYLSTKLTFRRGIETSGAFSFQTRTSSNRIGRFPLEPHH